MTLAMLPALLWTLVTPSADPLVIHARAAMYALEPAPRSPEIADAIVTVVRWRGPLPGLTLSRSVDVMLAIAETEGKWDAFARGDGGYSVGWGQIFHGPKALLGDALATARVVHEMASASFYAGRSLPLEDRLSVYARGRNCPRGRELSRVKMRLAKQIGGR